MRLLRACGSEAATLEIARTCASASKAVRSGVHEAEGAMVTLPQPIGYLVEEAGRAVAARRSANLHARLGLALFWEPSDG